jgi:hypothetical protein
MRGSLRFPSRAGRALAGGAVVVTLSAACSDADTPVTGPGAMAMAPVAARDASRGADVFRQALLLIGVVYGGEPSSGLAVSVGAVDPVGALAESCADPSAFIMLAPGRAQVVTTPSGTTHNIASGDEVPVAVFAYGGGIVTSSCQLVGAPVVATGTVRYSLQLRFGESGAQVAHASAHGIVTLAAGGQARLWSMWRQVTRPDGTVVFDSEPVELKPL